MKILHVYKDFYPPVHGGIEKYISLMCRFQRQWAAVEVLVCNRSCRTRIREVDGVRVIEAGSWARFQSAPVAPIFPFLLYRSKADIFVLHVPNPTAELSWLVARPPGGKLVVRYHSDIVRQQTAMLFYKPIQMKFLRQSDIILPTSTMYLDSSPMLAPVRNRCVVVPLGIDVALFRQGVPEKVGELKRRYGRYVLFAGRHRYYKGLPVLIRAARHIQARVIIAGDGPEREKCQRLARQIDCEKDIVFTGTLSSEELVAYLHGCEVFVFPSTARSEAFGLSILEAHACGKPVVATRLGTGVEWVNQDGVTGFNVMPGSPEALAEAVNSLLNNNALRFQLGEQARTRVMQKFDVRKIALQEMKLYQSL